MAKAKKTALSAEEGKKLLATLKSRFEKNVRRHKDISWESVQQRIEKNAAALSSLFKMEATGGEPDVIAIDKKTGAIHFADCAAESPAGRRSLCYDREGWDSRKDFKPADTAMDMAQEMGIVLLNEEQYRHLQTLGSFDTKTSSWLLTPAPIRKHGGAIFGDRRYEHVFIYHNGAGSYYAARGFRGLLIV